MEYTGIDKAPKESLDSKPYLETSKFINSLIGSSRYSLSHLLLQKASRHGQDHKRVADDARQSGGRQHNKRGGRQCATIDAITYDVAYIATITCDIA